MRKALTIGILALAVATMAFAGVSAPKTSATASLCHSTALSIKAPTSVRAGRTITVTGAEARTPGHTVKATLQYRKGDGQEVDQRSVEEPVVRRLFAQVEGPRQEGQVQAPRARDVLRYVERLRRQDGDRQVDGQAAAG